MRGCVRHFVKWQIHPFLSKGTNCALCVGPSAPLDVYCAKQMTTPIVIDYAHDNNHNDNHLSSAVSVLWYYGAFKAKRQYLLTLQVSRYRLLTLKSRMICNCLHWSRWCTVQCCHYCRCTVPGKCGQHCHLSRGTPEISCGEGHWPRGSVFDLKPPGFAFQIMSSGEPCHVIHLTILSVLSRPSLSCNH